MIWDACSSSLYTHVLAVVRRRADAEDVVQDVFVKIARERRRFLGCRNLPAYLHRMAHNLAVSFIRRRAQAETLVDSARIELEPAMSAPSDLEHVDVTRIGTALAALPEPQRVVIILKIFDCRTFREIARLLGIPLFTVASRYRYAIEKLRKAIKEGSHES